jgi:HD-like signal output (HDOD) protein
MTTTTAVDPQVLAREAIAKVTTLATLPEVTVQILRTVEDPRSSASQLHRIVSNDPALVARILKVVNSAFYGLPGQVASIERAIVLLGLHAVKNLAVAASLGQLFRGNLKLCGDFAPKDLWAHCVGVGVAARGLARMMKLHVADEAFLAGMIHDVGLVVHLQVTPEKLRQVCERSLAGEADFCQIEREVIGVDHQEMGRALAAHWKFPRTCQMAAGYHHRPEALGEEGHILVSLVHVADVLCCQEHIGFDLTAREETINSASLKSLDLDMASVEEFRQTLPQVIEAAATVVG